MRQIDESSSTIWYGLNWLFGFFLGRVFTWESKEELLSCNSTLVYLAFALDLIFEFSLLEICDFLLMCQGFHYSFRCLRWVDFVLASL